MTRQVIEVTADKYDEVFEELIKMQIMQRQLYIKRQLRSEDIQDRTPETEIYLRAVQQLMNEEKLPLILITDQDKLPMTKEQMKDLLIDFNMQCDKLGIFDPYERTKFIMKKLHEIEMSQDYQQ